jgi:hypothetical protein
VILKSYPGTLYFILKMEAENLSEKFINITRHHKVKKPEDHNFSLMTKLEGSCATSIFCPVDRFYSLRRKADKCLLDHSSSTWGTQNLLTGYVKLKGIYYFVTSSE